LEVFVSGLCGWRWGCLCDVSAAWGGFDEEGGTLELLGPCGAGASAGAAGKESELGLVDEIIVTALVTIRVRMREGSAASASGAANAL
jgi:hypothetical protein